MNCICSNYSRYLLEKIDNKIIRSNNESGAEIQLAIDDAYKRLLLPSLTTEALNLAKEKADEADYLYHDL